MPDRPKSPGLDPMCLDANAMAWVEALIAHQPPPEGRPGMMYMLAGGSDASNTDPYASGPTADNHWIATGPHVMMVGAKGAPGLSARCRSGYQRALRHVAGHALRAPDAAGALIGAGQPHPGTLSPRSRQADVIEEASAPIASVTGSSQTAVSWMTAPPLGGAGSALSRMLTPMPSAQCWFGQMLSTTMVVSCWPADALACTTSEPRSLPSRIEVAVGQAELRHGVRAQQRGRALLALQRGRHLGEGRVQELARRGRDQAVGLVGGRLVAGRHVVGQLRHQVAVRPEARPVGLEAEAAVGGREAVQVMRLAEVRARCSSRRRRGPSRHRASPSGAADRRSAPTRSWRSRDARRPAASPARR